MTSFFLRSSSSDAQHNVLPGKLSTISRRSFGGWLFAIDQWFVWAFSGVGWLVHAVILAVVRICKEAVLGQMNRERAPGGLLPCKPRLGTAGRLEDGKVRGRADAIEDLDQDVVSEDESDAVHLSHALLALCGSMP